MSSKIDKTTPWTRFKNESFLGKIQALIGLVIIIIITAITVWMTYGLLIGAFHFLTSEDSGGTTTACDHLTCEQQ